MNFIIDFCADSGSQENPNPNPKPQLAFDIIVIFE
jgi:hypothetical protein